MLIHTPGIVLKNTKYSDTSVISKIYTRQLGMQTYMINGVRSARAAIKPSLLQPLVMLDMVVYRNPVKEIQRIKEARSSPVLSNLHFEVVKSTVGLFVSELMYKTIREEEPNERLYDFAAAYILALDAPDCPIAVMPAYFAVQLSGYMGFAPAPGYSEDAPYFHISEGLFSPEPGRSGDTLSPPESGYLAWLSAARLDELHLVRIPKASRQLLLEKLMDYYTLHIPNFHGLNSLGVLSGLMKEAGE